MKKLLVLMLVFAMASLANATPVDDFIAAVDAAMEFSVNGEPQPAEISIDVGSSITLDWKLLTGHTLKNVDFTWQLSNTSAELLAGNMVLDDGFDMGLSSSQADAQNVKIFGGQVWTPTGLAGPRTLMDLLTLQCLEMGDVTLDIIYTGTTKLDGEEYYSNDVPLGTVVHSLLVHQVPEPATMVLLSLGGLLIRRKKNA